MKKVDSLRYEDDMIVWASEGSARFKKGSITLGFHFWCLFWICCSLVGKMWCASVFTISCEDIFSPLQWVQ